MEQRSAGEIFEIEVRKSRNIVVYCATEGRIIADFDGPNANTMATDTALAHYASYRTPHIVLLTDTKKSIMEKVEPDGTLTVLTNAD